MLTSALLPAPSRRVRVCASASQLQCAGKLITRDELRDRAISHLLEITTLLVLVLLVLITDLLMAVVLQYIVTKQRGAGSAKAAEVRSLVSDEADDDDD